MARRARKHPTSSAPGEGALAHDWLMQVALPTVEVAPVKKGRGGARPGAGRKPKPKEPVLAAEIIPTRAPEFSNELANEICERIALGETLGRICEERGMPDRRSVWRWRQKHADFAKAFEAAQRDQAHSWADDLLTIADDSSSDVVRDEDGNERVNHENIQRARLRFDARRFLMAKHYPALYGDRQQVDLNVGANLASDLEKARQRAISHDALNDPG